MGITGNPRLHAAAPSDMAVKICASLYLDLYILLYCNCNGLHDPIPLVGCVPSSVSIHMIMHVSSCAM